MRPKYAKQILGCTYSTLHNYVKRGKLKLAENPTTTKQQEYDDMSVYELAETLKGRKLLKKDKKLMKNAITVNTEDKSYTFLDIADCDLENVLTWLSCKYECEEELF